eukprot:1155327-Pelagomonas_calceolata.AAC.1
MVVHRVIMEEMQVDAIRSICTSNRKTAKQSQMSVDEIMVMCGAIMEEMQVAVIRSICTRNRETAKQNRCEWMK